MLREEIPLLTFYMGLGWPPGPRASAACVQLPSSPVLERDSLRETQRCFRAMASAKQIVVPFQRMRKYPNLLLVGQREVCVPPCLIDYLRAAFQRSMPRPPRTRIWDRWSPLHCQNHFSCVQLQRGGEAHDKEHPVLGRKRGQSTRQRYSKLHQPVQSCLLHSRLLLVQLWLWLCSKACCFQPKRESRSDSSRGERHGQITILQGSKVWFGVYSHSSPHWLPSFSNLLLSLEKNSHWESLVM